MIPLSEYKRKLIHLFNLAIPFGYLYVFPEKWVFVKLLSILMVLFIIFDILRHKVAWVKSLFSLFIDSMIRSHMGTDWCSYIHYIIFKTSRYYCTYFYEYWRHCGGVNWSTIWET